MEEHHETLLKPKWGLFSRKRQEETEQLYDSMEAPEEPVKPLTEAESIGEEPELSEVASEEREAYKSRHRSLGFAFFTALVPIAAMAAEQSGVTVPFWTGDRQIQGVAMLACLLIELVLCWHVPVYAIRKLSEKRCVSALLVSLAVLAAVVDCALWLLVPGRGEALPYTAAAGLALCFAQWGISRESRGSYDSFRLASLDDHPPYLVTETPRGACKQRGDLRGFYTTAMRDDYAFRLQTVFLPVIFMAALVFAGLTSLGRGHGIDFLRNWSVILTAGATICRIFFKYACEFSFPRLVFPLFRLYNKNYVKIYGALARKGSSYVTSHPCSAVCHSLSDHRNSRPRNRMDHQQVQP